VIRKEGRRKGGREGGRDAWEDGKREKEKNNILTEEHRIRKLLSFRAFCGLWPSSFLGLDFMLCVFSIVCKWWASVPFFPFFISFWKTSKLPVYFYLNDSF